MQNIPGAASSWRGTCRAVGWPARVSASVSSNSRARSPSVCRSGVGSAGKLCMGGKPRNSVVALGECVATVSASDRICCDHTRRRRNEVTSFAPVDTRIKSAGCAGSLVASFCSTRVVVAPIRPTLVHSTLRLLRALTSCARQAVRHSSGTRAPTPAMIESPRPISRSGGAESSVARAFPYSAPSGAAKRGVRRLTHRACGSNHGTSDQKSQRRMRERFWTTWSRGRTARVRAMTPCAARPPRSP